MNFSKGTWYQHRYGGIYQMEGVARSTVDGKTFMVAYYHRFPFNEELWIRPMEEWTSERFREMSPTEAHHIMEHNDAEAFQALVTANKQKAAGDKVKEMAK